MNIQEPGVLPASLRYFFTPSSFAEQVLFYLTRVGSYVCDRNYYFSGQSEIGLNPTHHQHFMLILIGAGSLQLNINEHAYTAQSGDIIFVDCKMPHEYHAGPSGVTFDWIVFDGIGMQELFHELRNYTAIARYFLPPHIRRSGRLQNDSSPVHRERFECLRPHVPSFFIRYYAACF